MKKNFKFLITVALLIITFSSVCFASNSVMPVPENTLQKQSEKKDINSDLYISDKEYEMNNIIKGNVFASVDILNITPEGNGGIIGGNLFATANNVNIKSELTYSENEKDTFGNPVIYANKTSTIYGNVYVIANKFVLDPGSEIGGDLYVCANEVDLRQNSEIQGNVYVIANTLDVNSQIRGDLYAHTKNCNMKYYGFIQRDLHLNANNAHINGYIYRNSFISSKNIILDDKFINKENFNVENANKITICGEIKGDANINSKNINFDTKKSTCIIKGNLNYSSNKKLNLEESVVLKEINYSKYKNNIWSGVLNHCLNFATVIVCTYVLYFLINKYTKNYLSKITNISSISLLKYFGMSIGILLLVPILVVLLCISRIGFILGLIALASYIILLLLAEPVFIISISTFIKDKLPIKINIYLYLLIIAFILSLIFAIPYLGFVLLMLIKIIGIGMIIKNLFPNKKA